MTKQELTVIDDCWNRIGVYGDASCEELSESVHCRNCSVFSQAGRHLLERAPSPEDVQEWTDELARPSESLPEGTIPVIIFRVGEEWLSLDVAVAVEVAAARKMQRIPHRTNEILRGLVNVRGELQLCASMRNLIGIQGPPNLEGQLLIIERQKERWALEVDEVVGVEHLQRIDVRDVPATVSNSLSHFARWVLMRDDRHVGHLDVERVMVALRENVG